MERKGDAGASVVATASPLTADPSEEATAAIEASRLHLNSVPPEAPHTIKSADVKSSVATIWCREHNTSFADFAACPHHHSDEEPEWLAGDSNKAGSVATSAVNLAATGVASTTATDGSLAIERSGAQQVEVNRWSPGTTWFQQVIVGPGPAPDCEQLHLSYGEAVACRRAHYLPMGQAKPLLARVEAMHAALAAALGQRLAAVEEWCRLLEARLAATAPTSRDTGGAAADTLSAQLDAQYAACMRQCNEALLESAALTFATPAGRGPLGASVATSATFVASSTVPPNTSLAEAVDPSSSLLNSPLTQASTPAAAPVPTPTATPAPVAPASAAPAAPVALVAAAAAVPTAPVAPASVAPVAPVAAAAAVPTAYLRNPCVVS